MGTRGKICDRLFPAGFGYWGGEADCRENLGIVRKGLVLQQFKEANIVFDTTGYTKERFFRQLETVASADKSVNDLLVQIVRNGRIAGSPLNKIGMLQELYIPEKTIVSRDAENVLIKLVTPKASVERGAILSAIAERYDINGFALCKDNKPVKTLKINGKPVKYDADLKFFENTISLSDGINKVVIEATDDAGFTATRIIQLDLKNKTVVAAGKGKGSCIWEPLSTWEKIFDDKGKSNDLIAVFDEISNEFMLKYQR